MKANSVGFDHLVKGVGAKPASHTVNSSDQGQFGEILKNKLDTSNPTRVSELSFSNHAIERIQQRNIPVNPTNVGRIQEGVEKAASKGAKNALVLMDNFGFIVNVGNNKVVTAIDKSLMKENVFTNIDSTVFV